MWARDTYARLMNLARRSQRGAEKSPTLWIVGGLALAFLLLVLGNLGRIAKMIRVRRLQAHPERSPDEAAAMWYERMARYLARQGVKKSAAQTAQEFARAIGDEPLKTRVGRFTNAYESARFGNSAEDAQRLPGLYEEVETATRK
jgi:hypothetical protein